LAVGFEDGTIRIYEIEGGECVTSFKNGENKVTYLEWVEEMEMNLPNKRKHIDENQFFLSLKPYEDVDDENKQQKQKKNKIDFSQTKLNILIAADAENKIKFYAYGNFFMSQIDMQKHLKESIKILHLFLSSDFKSLSVVYLCEPNNDQNLICFDTSVILKRKNELSEIAKQSANVISLFGYLEKGFDICSEKWNNS
jgi:WD40 repeat protein